MEQQIKQIRVHIDGLSQLTKELKPIKGEYLDQLKSISKEDLDKSKDFNSKEINEAVDSLLLAKAWLGKILQELGTPTPYKSDGSRHSIKDIEPTADRFKVPELIQVGNNKVFTDLNHIEKVDWLRQEIQTVIKSIEELYAGVPPTWKIAVSRTNTYNYLSEARFWLGFELGRIKENE